MVALVLAASGLRLVGVLVADLLGLYAIAIFAMCVLSFFPLRPDTFAEQVYRFLLRITDPVILPVRRAMPDMGTIDVSPVIVMLSIFLIRTLILG